MRVVIAGAAQWSDVGEDCAASFSKTAVNSHATLPPPATARDASVAVNGHLFIVAAFALAARAAESSRRSGNGHRQNDTLSNVC